MLAYPALRVLIIVDQLESFKKYFCTPHFEENVLLYQVLMASMNDGGFDQPLLEQHSFHGSKIKFDAYLGHGSAGFVFKVRVQSQTYALKLVSQMCDEQSSSLLIFQQFKFYYPELHPSRLQGKFKQAYYDSYLVECRANHSLIQQSMNGKHTPFCYGRMLVSASVEDHIAQRYNVQKFQWDRPPGTEDARVRGILYEYVEGKTLLEIPITSQIANSARAGLKGLHNASIAHGDIRASNILIQDDQARWVDLSTSISLPHVHVLNAELRKRQEDECLQLEIGFAFLLKVINKDPCFLFEVLTIPATYEPNGVLCRYIAYGNGGR